MLTNFDLNKAKKIFFFEKKIQNGRLKKTEWKVTLNLPMYLPCSADLCTKIFNGI